MKISSQGSLKYNTTGKSDGGRPAIRWSSRGDIKKSE
jgi:hypothetical protein